MLFLASRSPRRRKILKEIGIAFRSVPTTYKEEGIQKNLPSRLVIQHATGKAHGAKFPRRKGLVLAADTLVYCHGHVFGKPRTMKEAFQMIRKLSGQSHFVYTGIALLNPKTGVTLTGYAKTKVTFKKMDKGDIQRYLGQIHPLDKAGSYAVQKGAKIVKEIKGSYSNVLGLPKELLLAMLRDARRRIQVRSYSR